MHPTEVIDQLRAGQSLEASPAAIESAAAFLLDPDGAAERKADLLEALSAKGETPGEIAGFVRSFLLHAVRPPLDPLTLDRPAIDVCGTGGDKLNLFNISTASMFILAAGGAAVVKHGNRGITSKSGSADVLEALGVPTTLSPDAFAECVRKTGAGFMLAPHYHPTFKAVGPVRAALAAKGVRTIFNLIGPLLNPVQPPFQMIGIFDASLPPVYAEILRQLGRRKAWAVHGTIPDSSGMDEVSTLGPTRIAAVENGTISDTMVTVPLPVPALAELKGGDAGVNAAIITGILDGLVRGAKRDIVMANAAAGFQIAGLAGSWDHAITLAAECLDSGRARDVLDALRAFTASN